MRFRPSLRLRKMLASGANCGHPLRHLSVVFNRRCVATLAQFALQSRKLILFFDQGVRTVASCELQCQSAERKSKGFHGIE